MSIPPRHIVQRAALRHPRRRAFHGIAACLASLLLLPALAYGVPGQAPLFEVSEDQPPLQEVQIAIDGLSMPHPLVGAFLRVESDLSARDEGTGECRVLRRVVPTQEESAPPQPAWKIPLEIVSLGANTPCPDGPATGLVGPVAGRFVTLHMDGASVTRVTPFDPSGQIVPLQRLPWSSWPHVSDPPSGWTFSALRDGRLDLEEESQVVVRLIDTASDARHLDPCQSCTCIRELLRIDTGDPAELALVVQFGKDAPDSTQLCARLPNFEGYADLGTLPAGVWSFRTTGSVTVATRPSAPDH